MAVIAQSKYNYNSGREFQKYGFAVCRFKAPEICLIIFSKMAVSKLIGTVNS